MVLRLFRGVQELDACGGGHGHAPLLHTSAPRNKTCLRAERLPSLLLNVVDKARAFE